jgi:hypothetical protein
VRDYAIGSQRLVLLVCWQGNRDALELKMQEQYRPDAAHADTIIHLNHGYNSLNFWTELPPPTAWNATAWRNLVSPV